jgi:hypothetical protein
MERSLQWRRRYRFLAQGDLRRFEVGASQQC